MRCCNVLQCVASLLISEGEIGVKSFWLRDKGRGEREEGGKKVGREEGMVEGEGEGWEEGKKEGRKREGTKEGKEE